MVTFIARFQESAPLDIVTCTPELVADHVKQGASDDSFGAA